MEILSPLPPPLISVSPPPSLLSTRWTCRHLFFLLLGLYVVGIVHIIYICMQYTFVVLDLA